VVQINSSIDTFFEDTTLRLELADTVAQGSFSDIAATPDQINTLKMCDGAVDNLRDSCAEQLPTFMNLDVLVRDEYRKKKVLGYGFNTPGMVIGCGSFSDVVMLNLNKRLYALKLYKRSFDPEGCLIRQSAERQNSARANGLHTPEVLALGYEHNTAKECLLMEYIEGPTLLKLITGKYKQGTAGQLISIMTSLAHDLDKLHNTGVVHCDVTPQNVIVSNSAMQRTLPMHSVFPIKRTPYLLDLDLSVELPKTEEGFAPLELKEIGDVFGTPDTMSPEMWFDSKVVPATDQYALGIILYYVCTGGLPHKDETNLFKIMQRREDSIKLAHPIRPFYDKKMQYVIERCLERDPADRFSSCAELAYVLKSMTGKN
jgi:serine/threonine-protein kinase